jgi:hypothetical protein
VGVDNTASMIQWFMNVEQLMERKFVAETYYSKKTFPNVILFAMNLIWPDLESKTCRCSEKHAPRHEGRTTRTGAKEKEPG